jgi:hypothetical protein
MLSKFLGNDLSKNSCLIVTYCESKDEEQREKIRIELKKDVHFEDIQSFFKLGIFFSGSINRDDYNKGYESIVGQYKTSIDYRSALIDLFNDENIEPFQINGNLIKQLLETTDEEKSEQKLIEMQGKSINALKEALEAKEKVPSAIFDELFNSTTQLNEVRRENELNVDNVPECKTS